MSKASKHRSCPAARREISAAECGESRISRYQCPSDCRFNPFAPEQYDQFIAIEASVIDKSLNWFLQEAPRDRSLDLDEMSKRDRVEQQGWQIADFFYRRDASGRTCADRWVAAGLPGLKNDERVIQRATMQMRPRLIEVHRILDDLRVEVVDLFEPESKPFLICDRGLAAEACRFTTLFGWCFPLPHFWRVFGNVFSLPTIGSLEPAEIVGEIIRHLGGPEEPGKRNEWLGSNFARFCEAVDAVALARREQMFSTVDAEFGKAVYELRAPFAECRDVLDTLAMVSADELCQGERDEGFAETRVWFDEAYPATGVSAGRPVLGRVLLGQSHWRVEAIGREKLSNLRSRFEKSLGERVRFAGERRDDPLAHIKSKERKYDQAVVPPRLLENPTQLILTSSRTPAALAPTSPGEMGSQLASYFDRAWLDESVPALNGRTPREAARDPALRRTLIRLLKDRIRSADERNLESGENSDANWLPRELGVDELIYDPPPVREPIDGRSSLEDDEFDEADDLEPWPQLPPRPFTEEEAAARLEVALREFDSFRDAMDAMEAAGGYLTEDVHEVVGELLNEVEHGFLENYIVHVWFAFVPPGCFGPDIETSEIHAAFGRQLAALEVPIQSGLEASGHFLLNEGPQPAMVQLLAAQLAAHRDEYPGAAKFQKDSLSLMLIVLRTLIELLTAKCRGLAG